MGRPRNIEEVERLRDTAFELFAVKGLDATSYSDIAKNAYVTKSHVQHYFPKKEILVTLFVERSMEAVLKIARELPEFEAMDPLSKLVYVDYIQYYYAMYNEKMFRMSMDILLKRAGRITKKRGVKRLRNRNMACKLYHNKSPQKENKRWGDREI